MSLQIRSEIIILNGTPYIFLLLRVLDAKAKTRIHHYGILYREFLLHIPLDPSLIGTVWPENQLKCKQSHEMFLKKLRVGKQ